MTASKAKALATGTRVLWKGDPDDVVAEIDRVVTADQF